MLPLAVVLMLAGVALVDQRPRNNSHMYGRVPDQKRGAQHPDLDPLPFDEDSLVPWQSEWAVNLHHSKLQSRYVMKTRDALDRLDRLRNARGENAERMRFGATMSLVINASGALLHKLYWENLTPEPTRISSWLERMISKDFGSVSSLVSAFDGTAKLVPGSGWAVLAYSPYLRRMVILPVGDHDQFIIPGSIPILVCDLWEHAYYLDHPGDRPGYLQGFWNYVNWPVVENRLRVAMRA